MKRFMKKMLCLVLATACTLMAGCGTGGGQKESGLVVENCVVKTSLYECSYPEAMVDVIRVAESEDQTPGNLTFYAMLSGGESKIFDLKYNQNGGDFTVEFEKGDGKKVPVSFVMYDVPTGLNGSDEMTFCAAQEVVNDVISAMVLK